MPDVPLPKYGTTDGNDVNLLQAAQNNAEISQNSVSKLIVAFAGRADVISELSAPPGSPNELDIHLVGAAPSGDWSTFDEEDLAIFLDDAWYELDPFEGLTFWHQALNATFTYNGVTWQEGTSSIAASVTASTTQTQGQQPLTRRLNHVSVVANANDVVTLPTAVASLEIVVINAGANTLQVFPATGDNIDAAGANNSVTQAAGVVAHYFATDAILWWSIQQ